MSMSRIEAQYQARALLRQMRQVSEPVSYMRSASVPAVQLRAAVQREPGVREQRADALWIVHRAQLTVLSVVDAEFGGVVLDTKEDITAFHGVNFAIAIAPGETAVDGWIVNSVTGGPGTWELSVVREVKQELGKTRRNA